MKAALKKGLLIALCLLALIFVSSCGDKKTVETGKENQNSGQTVVSQDDKTKKDDQGNNANKDQNINNDDKQSQDPKEQDVQNNKDNKAQENVEETKDPENKDKVDEKDKEDKEDKEKEKESGIQSIVDENNRVNADFTYNGKSYGFRPNVKTYLIMGIDRYGEVTESQFAVGTGQCDAIYLLALDHDNDKYTLLQLDRDAMVDMSILGYYGKVIGTEVQQLALAHAYGDGKERSCELVVEAVSNWLNGLPIDGYAAFQFNALPILNDVIGGVEVEIEDDLTSVDPSFVKGSTVTLMGEKALSFARVRRGVSDGYNTSRMRRQRTYLSAFRTQLLSKVKESSNIINTMYNDSQAYTCTNLSLGTLTNIAGQAMNYSFGDFVNIEGEHRIVSTDGKNYMQFWADDDSLNRTVINLFCSEVK